MATSKPKRKLRTLGQSLWFYGAIGLSNLAVVGMFMMLSITPPVLAAPVPVIHHIVPRVIIQGIPTRVVVPSVTIDLPVLAGAYDPATNTWGISTAGAYYADTSVPINDSNGTTLIYAHGRTGLFGSLPNIRAGADADVYTDNGYVFHYTYQSVLTVDPSNTAIFTVDNPPLLALQTCSGDWSQYRILFLFTLTSVDKA